MATLKEYREMLGGDTYVPLGGGEPKPITDGVIARYEVNKRNAARAKLARVRKARGIAVAEVKTEVQK